MQGPYEVPLRYDWSVKAVEDIYSSPLPELIYQAQAAHRHYHSNNEVQGCALLSIKTGGCVEDCAYCPQSSRYDSPADRTGLISVEETLDRARIARAHGATRFCLGAAWREAPNGASFERILAMVRGIRDLGMEACCTLGMLNDQQAEALAHAGLSAYNHNLDTSREFYPKIITTRTYEERLDTLERVRRAGVTVCCGGIIGMGESHEDRCALLAQLASLKPHPESVPINLLVPVRGTPLANQPPVDSFELVRTIATARILMPASVVRLSAGRTLISDEAQALCFLAGANSIFIGDRLLTTPNPKADRDKTLLERLGMRLTSTSAAGTNPPAQVSVIDPALEISCEVTP